MTSESDQDVFGYFFGAFAGFFFLLLFGAATLAVCLVSGLKKPADRIESGDFSADETKTRLENLAGVREMQAKALDTAKVDAAIRDFKASPPAASGSVVPGSATSLKAANAQGQKSAAKSGEETEDAAKGTPQKDKSKGKAKAKAPQSKGKDKPKSAKAPPPKSDGGKATSKAGAKPKANAKGKAKTGAKAAQKAKGKGAG